MRVLELFETITSVPRCSGTHQPFIDFVKEFSLKNNFVCQIDDVNNILCFKKDGKRDLCLQSHYDIVCLVDGKIPEIIYEDGYIKAKDSTLGSDNGIGCSYMLALMEENIDCEYLFTCDEEIGLIGANNITLELKASKMLNLDSEEEGEICIGCAGGVDIFANSNKTKFVNTNSKFYEITVEGLVGGHSGVDIDKNIPNALKLIIETIIESKCEVLELNGGERINSIPKKAIAIVACKTKPLPNNKYTIIKEIDPPASAFKVDEKLIHALYSFANGIRDFDTSLNTVLTSINLAIINTSDSEINIELSARSMDNIELNRIKNETINYFELFNCNVTTDGKYPAWKPETNDFTNEVLNIYKKHNKNASLEAIHAGLECAIFKDKYPQLNVASIGPTIQYPHSNREQCEVESVKKVFSILKEIVLKNS
jgi:dipeptidase D